MRLNILNVYRSSFVINNKKACSWPHSYSCSRKGPQLLNSSRSKHLFLKSNLNPSCCCFLFSFPLNELLVGLARKHISALSLGVPLLPACSAQCWGAKRACVPLPMPPSSERQIKWFDSRRQAALVRCNHLWLKSLSQIYNGLININREAYLFSSSPMSLRVDKMLVK